MTLIHPGSRVDYVIHDYAKIPDERPTPEEIQKIETEAKKAFEEEVK